MLWLLLAVEKTGFKVAVATKKRERPRATEHRERSGKNQVKYIV